MSKLYQADVTVSWEVGPDEDPKDGLKDIQNVLEQEAFTVDYISDARLIGDT